MIVAWLWALPLDLIDQAARTHGIERELLAAICQTESAGKKRAWRYESEYRWTYHPRELAESLEIDPMAEERWQKTSNGLCQVMGALAREMGYRGTHDGFFDPAVNLEYGARFFSRLLRKYHKTEEAVAAYNAGTAIYTPGGMFKNQGYVDRVMGYHRELKRLE